MRQLELISGIVRDLIVAKGFDDPVFSQGAKTVAGSASIAAAALGEYFTSSALANSSQGAEIGVEYFTCTINSLPLSGHFYKVEFKDGDRMEFVIEHGAGGAVVNGARSSIRRYIWMLPYQTRGLSAQKYNDTRWRILLSSSSSAVCLLMILSILTPDINLPIWVIPSNLAFVFLITLGISFMVTRRFHEFAVQATEVLNAFGYENASSVDLPALSKLAEKRMKMQEDASPTVYQSYQPWRFRY